MAVEQIPLHKTLADHLVDSPFDEARGDWLAMTVAVSVVHDKALVVLEVTDELLQFGRQPGLLGTAIRGEFPTQALKPLQRRIRAAVPEVPLWGSRPFRGATRVAVSRALSGV